MPIKVPSPPAVSAYKFLENCVDQGARALGLRQPESPQDERKKKMRKEGQGKDLRPADGGEKMGETP